ncbi:MAG: AmmeMemoRadiSam system protein B [Chlorobiota bacterium]
MEFYPLRPGLQWSIATDQASEPVLTAHDPLEYTPQPFAVPLEAYPVIEALAESQSWEELWQHLAAAGIRNSPAHQRIVSDFVQQLDSVYALRSPRFDQRRRAWEAEYRSYPIRTAALAGICYPEAAPEIAALLDSSLQSAPTVDVPAASPIAAVIPHIDLRVGISSYAAAYQVLQQLQPELVVVLGTSHYGWHAPFIVTEKDFQTPLGTMPTARSLVRQFVEACPVVVTDTDLAHKPEHSLEFQVVFLQHLFGNGVELFPVLLTSFGDLIPQRRSPSTDSALQYAIRTLREIIASSGRRTLWIASADMAHVGRKFGDDADARLLLPEVEQHDRALIAAMCRADAEEYFQLIAAVEDRYRICGLSPVYTLLAALQPRYGVLADYRQWYESETLSAVTFSSVLYYG